MKNLSYCERDIAYIRTWPVTRTVDIDLYMQHVVGGELVKR